MTPSPRKIYLLLPTLLLAGAALAAPPPDAEMAAAQAALTGAERSQPSGTAAQMLDEARQNFVLAQAAMDKRKFKDARNLADRTTAAADLATAMARLAALRQEVDTKAARNAELRRRLLVVPESQP
jgi:putative intracellular protease/amidase